MTEINRSVFYRSSRAQVLSITVDAASKWLRNEKGLDFLYLKMKKKYLPRSLGPGLIVHCSNADPDPNPDSDLPNPHVFGPPESGSGSISERYGSGSGSFHQPAKIVRKTLIPTIF